MRHVILPQAVRRVAPPLLNDFVALQKDVALISILGPQEAFRIAQIIQGENFNYTPLIAAALLYLAVTVPLARVVDRMGGGPRGGAVSAARARPVLEVRGVTKAFGEREVLRGDRPRPSHEHEAVALIGASGSGKSTLLRCIDLLEEIDDGDVFLDGEVITDPAVDAGRGAPPARPRLPGLQPLPAPDRAAERGPRRDAGARRLPAPRPRSAAATLLARFGLEGREDDRPDNLSGGQQQRVAIARAFAGRPRALLLDEVTSALDPELVGEVLAAVRDLKAEGMTMVIATHEMSFAREVADEVAFLHEGRIVESGPPERVLVEPAAAGDPALPQPPARGRADLSGLGEGVSGQVTPVSAAQPKADLVLGPLLRYVGETEATVWVETDSPCEVEVLGRREPTFTVEEHHYALVRIEGLEPAGFYEYEVSLDGERRWPAGRVGAAAERDPHARPRRPDRRLLRLLPGRPAPRGALRRTARTATKTARSTTRCGCWRAR